MTLAAVSRPKAGTAFSWGLIIATVLPFCTIGMDGLAPGAGAIAAGLIILGSTHAFATVYLLADADVRRFCRVRPVRMIAVPIALVAGGIVLFSQATGIGRTMWLTPFLLYQAWHFGAQNIGVAAFISRQDRHRPLARNEKLLIKLGILAGILGVLKAMATVFHSSDLGPFGARLVDLAYAVGFAAAIPLALVAGWMMVRACRDGHAVFGISLFLSVCFFAPMYLSHDHQLGYISFTIAHGLQYLIFLIVHCAGQTRPRVAPSRLGRLLGPAVLLAAVLIGHFLWNMKLARSVPAIGIAIVPALTLGHFWLDLFVWRLRDRERASWVQARFGFVLA